MKNAMLTINELSIAYGNTVVVQDVSLQLSKGEIGCFLGPSGCGKTTLLRAIAGFEPVKQGEVLINGTIVSNRNAHLAPEARNIGMVFQDFALFPHLTVADNIGFGIRHHKRFGRAERKDRIRELLALIGLESMQSRYPHELSGGQQQRIALARALAPKPHLLLLDEPFSSMDVELRAELAEEVRQILKQEEITSILVSHDQNEAFAMADHIGVLRDGTMQQWATGYQLYHNPENLFVADFIGQGALIDGVVEDSDSISTSSLGMLEGSTPQGCKSGCKVKVLVRPDDILHDDCSPRKVLITARKFRGANYLYTLELEDGTELLSLVHSHHDHKVGEQLGITLEIEHLVVFPSN